MVDTPQGYRAAAARPVPYTTAVGRAMNMQAIVNGWLPEVRGWNCTVSDQFMLVVGGGTAQPTVMEFPITLDGVWRTQFPLGTYFNAPVAGVYQPGANYPAAQPVPDGYRMRVNRVSVEVGWIPSFPVLGVWDPGDYIRWFWKRKTPKELDFSVVQGTEGRPCRSRTSYGTDLAGVANHTYIQNYEYPVADMPPIFLEPGDLSILRVENYTSNAGQMAAVSISCSGVMWPIGLEGS